MEMFGTFLLGLAGSLVSSALFDNKPDAPQQAPAVTPPAPVLPTPEPVTPMPTVDDEAVKMQKRRSIAEQQRRRGRASTILTDVADEPLGG